MRIRRVIAFLIAAFILALSVPGTAFADGQTIKLYIDNVEQSLENKCFISDGIVYVPMQELFFKMGVYMEWNEKEGLWYGEGNNGEIRITVGSTEADIDWVDVALPGPVLEKNGVVMIPLYLVEDALRTDAPVYDEKTRSIYIKFPDITYKPKEEFKIESVVNDLPEGVDLFKEEWLYNLQPDASDELIGYSTVEVEGMPFKKAIELEMKPVDPFPKMIYGVQKHVVVDTGDFNAGDVGLMTFWARATKITDESGFAMLRPAYEQMGQWNKAQEKTVEIGPEWKKYYLLMYNNMHSLKSGASHLTFSIGGKAQIIQIADFHMYNYGKQISVEMLDPDKENINYKGIEDDALWRKEAYRRIEKYRKNDMIVTVKDENGNPVEGATVNADMTDNEFMFGLAICDREFLNLDTENSKVARIQSDVLDKYFNAGVSGDEMKERLRVDNYSIAVREMNEYLKRGKRLRGHALSWGDLEIRRWPHYTYERLLDKTVSWQEAGDYLNMVNKGKLWLFKGVITQWDGTNEPVDSGGEFLYEEYGNGKIYADVFKMAKGIDPKSKLFVNETGIQGRETRNDYSRIPRLVEIIHQLKDDNRAPVDAIGVQGHCISYLYPQGFYQDLKTLAKEVDEVAITEYDFSNINMENAPQHMRDTFLATYSLPKASCFVVWGYYDPMHWRRVGPFYDEDWNKKPALDEWNRLVHDEFETHEKAVTDKNGNAVIRGYRGKYDITVTAGDVVGKTEFTLTDSDNMQRDNYINVTVGKNEMKIENPNPYETYANNNSVGKVKFNNWTEAYADYLEKVGDKELIGVYKHSDNNGNTVPKTNDGLYNTYWYGKGNDYVQYELVEKAEYGNVSVDFRSPNKEVYKYRVLSSKDGENWDVLFEGKSDEKKTVDFKDAMFIRIQSVDNEYMGISEVNLYAEKN